MGPHSIEKVFYSLLQEIKALKPHLTEGRRVQNIFFECSENINQYFATMVSGLILATSSKKEKKLIQIKIFSNLSFISFLIAMVFFFFFFFISKGVLINVSAIQLKLQTSKKNKKQPNPEIIQKKKSQT